MHDSSPIEVVCGLIFHGGRVLACRRDPGRSFPLMWEFPGGKRQDGENPETALHRELEEELRLRIRILRALDPVAYNGGGHDILLIPFVCQPDQEEAPTPLDHIEIRWVPVNRANRLTWAPADIPLVESLSRHEALRLPGNAEKNLGQGR
ncbi:MAG: NUDIX domain-containing protein [Oceanipulchritudo sp.]